MKKERFDITIGDETAAVATAAELVVALDVLQGRHDREVLSQLGPRLPEIIRDSRGLYAVLKALAPEDLIFFVELLGPRVGGLLDRAAGLRDILAMLSVTEVEARLLEMAGAQRLRDLIETPADLAGMLEWLYGDGDRILLGLLGDDFLRGLFQSGAELSLVLSALDRSGQAELLKVIGTERLLSLTRDGLDLRLLLRALPPELSRSYLESFAPERLRSLVRNRRGWADLLRVLEPEEERFLRPVWEAGHAE